MDRAIVFLGGIPAAGKTTLAGAVAAATGCLHVRASQLIRCGRALVAERPDVVDLVEATQNQRALVAGFDSVCAGTPGPILLDGHFTVPTAQGTYLVEEAVFASLHLSAVALLEIDVETCASRLRARPALPMWWDGSTTALTILQEQEQAAFHRIASRLRLRRIAATRDGLAAAVRWDR